MRHIRKASPVKPIKHTTLTRSQMHHSIIHTIQKKILEIATIIKLLNNTSEKKGCLNTMYFYHRSNHRPSSHIWHYTSGTEKASRCFLLSPSQSTRSQSNVPVKSPSQNRPSSHIRDRKSFSLFSSHVFFFFKTSWSNSCRWPYTYKVV